MPQPFINPVTRNSQGKQTNPVDATVHADTGALASAIYDVKVMAGSSVAALWIIQVRDAANTGNVGSTHTFYTAAGQSAEFVIEGLALNKDERVRVVNDGAITGTTAASVFAYRAA